MIVACTHCEAKFNLPDEKMKPEGVKIRCTKCQNIFSVSPPQKNPSLSETKIKKNDDFLSDTMDDDGGLDEKGGDSSDFDFGAEKSISVDKEMDFDSDQDDEFNVGGDKDDLDVGGDDFDFKTDDGSSLDADGSTDFDLDEPSDSKKTDEFKIESSDDLDFRLEDSDSSGDGGLLDGAEGDFDLPSIEEKKPTVKAPPPPPPRGATPQSPSSLNDGDFSFDDFNKKGGGSIPGNSLDFGDSIDFNAGAKTNAGFDEPFPSMEEPYMTKVQSRKARASRTSPVAVALFIVFLLAVGSYFVYSTFFGGEKFDISTVMSLFQKEVDPLDGLSVVEKKLDYFYAINKEVGKILVIKGEVINKSEYPKGRIKVKVVLFNNGGKELKNREVYCGNVLTLEELENLSKEDINKTLEKAEGMKTDNMRVKPGGSIEFMFVIFGIPEDTDTFNIDITGAQNVG